MGTSAMIGIYDQKDGSVTASYCHYDGYLEGVGDTLATYYNSSYDAEIVAKGGYISALYDDYLKSRENSVHNDKAVVYSSIEEYLKEEDTDFLYVYDGEGWLYTETYVAKFEEVQINC